MMSLTMLYIYSKILGVSRKNNNTILNMIQIESNIHAHTLLNLLLVLKTGYNAQQASHFIAFLQVI